MSEGDLQACISVIRALLTSRKDPPTLEELMRDYRELEGENIAFRKFGFTSLEALLLQSGEFNVLRSTYGATRVQAKPSSETDHIRDMVRKQKTVAKKRPVQQRKPRGNDNWNSTAFHSVYGKTQSYIPRNNHQSFSYALNNNQMPQNNNQWKEKNQNKYNSPLQLANMHLQQQPAPRRKSPENVAPQNQMPPQPSFQNIPAQNSTTMNPFAQTVMFKPTVPPPKFNHSTVATAANQQQEQKPSKPAPTTYSNGRPILSQSTVRPQLPPVATNQSTDILPPKRQVQRPTFVAATAQGPTTQHQPALPLNSERVPYSPIKYPQEMNNNQCRPASKLASRLLVKPKVYSNGDAKEESKTPSPPPAVVNSPCDNLAEIAPLMRLKKTQTEGLNPVQILEAYCQNRKETPPVFKFFKMQKSGRFQCRLSIGSAVYSTYPDDFATETEAQMAVASNAWNQLRETEDQLKYPVCMADMPQLALMVYNLLLNSPHGVFQSRIQEMFCDEYKELLPDNWNRMIMSLPHLFIFENSIQNIEIISAAPQMTQRDFTSEIEEKVAGSNEFPLEPLELPWDEKHWNLHISNVKSSVEIWARLIGKDYSELYDTNITLLEMDMLTKRSPAKVIEIGGIYLASLADCWYRVRVRKTDKDGSKSFVFFVDIGEEDWFAHNQLFPCDKSYLSFPPQAIMLSLFGLEDFAENEHALHILQNQLCGKTLIGAIRTEQSEYKNEYPCYEPKIETVLYDTSSEDDVNLNQLCINMICENTEHPKLLSNTSNQVIFTHVSDNGDIFCNKAVNGIQYIEKLIYQIAASKFCPDKHRATIKEMESPSELFLVKDNSPEKWYRAVILSTDEADTQGCSAYCVDFGYTKYINVNSIFRLSALSVALYKYPAQAIKVHAVDIPMNLHWISRLKALLPNKNGFAKISELILVPKIRIFIRNENGLMYCINETLRIERELEISQELIESPSKTGSSVKQQLPNISDRTLQTLKPNIVPPVGTGTSLFVTNTSHPGNFIVRPYDNDIELQDMMNNLQRYCQNPKPVTQDTLFMNGAYAVKHSDQNWYRAILLMTIGEELYQVFLCDYGDIEVITVDKLKLLPDEFKILPKQALKARVHGIKPRYGDWTVENCLRFTQLSTKKPLFATVMSCQREDFFPNEYSIDVVLCDTTGDDDIYIHDVLINEGHALPAN